MSLAILLLISYFVLALIVQKVMSKAFCAMCASVTLSWLTLLILDFKNIQINPLIIGILMGGSVVGLIYYLFRNKNHLELFKFPLLVLLFWLVFITVGGLPTFWVRDISIMGGLWVFFFFIHILHQNSKFKSLARRIAECCKNW